MLQAYTIGKVHAHFTNSLTLGSAAKLRIDVFNDTTSQYLTTKSLSKKCFRTL